MCNCIPRPLKIVEAFQTLGGSRVSVHEGRPPHDAEASECLSDRLAMRVALVDLKVLREKRPQLAPKLLMLTRRGSRERVDAFDVEVSDESLKLTGESQDERPVICSVW